MQINLNTLADQPIYSGAEVPKREMALTSTVGCGKALHGNLLNAPHENLFTTTVVGEEEEETQALVKKKKKWQRG